MKLYILRHGECNGNVSGVVYGQTNYPLTEKGRYQAQTLSTALRKLPVDRVICSPLHRTRETAQLALENRLPLETDRRLLEQNMGDWEGQTVSSIESNDAELYRAMLADWTKDSSTPPHGESFSDLKKRVSDFLSDVLSIGKNTLIVTHAGVIAAILVCLLRKEDAFALSLDIPPASLITVDITDGQAVLVSH